MNDSAKFMLITLPLAVIAFIIVCAVSVSINKNKMKQYELARERVESGWTCYLEGKELDVDTINLSEFNVTFNEDKKYVILTKRKDRGFLVPIIPIISTH